MNSFVSANITSIIEEVQERVRSLIDQDIRLAPKFLRLAFHDAVSLNCLNMSNPDNLGLEYPVSALGPIVQQYQGILSRSDIWVLASLVACEVTSGGWKFPMYYHGRVGAGWNIEATANNCQYVTPRPFPSADLTSHGLLQYFANTFGFNTRETVVIMGAHTLGEFARNQSGFNDGSAWVDQRHVLNNEYYALLVGGGRSSSLSTKVDDAQFWERLFLDNEGRTSTLGTTIPDRFMWTRRSGATEEGGNHDLPLIMTNADIALVRDLAAELDSGGSGRVKCDFAQREDCASLNSRCPVAKSTIHMMSEFKYNNTQWLLEFESVLRKMFIHGYDVSTGIDDRNCDENSRCLYLVDPLVVPPKESAEPAINPTLSPTQSLTVRPTKPRLDMSDPPTYDVSNKMVPTTKIIAIAASVTVVLLLGALAIFTKRLKNKRIQKIAMQQEESRKEHGHSDADDDQF